ncbi:cupin domain-containing protein [Rhodococcus sp. LB1]|uniref:cupin domain-containing protein n=1 Tax=Rhodococcus sp. LB1 TaxID=1807499 RepID=UPI00077B028E|nr:cupin domain-containing protein [Rhodococcus sp. LB1]KXX55885.1 hypothetical protein AZG88_02310 [Rhodococcus sp. LB1]
MKIRRVVVTNSDGSSQVVEAGEPPRTSVYAATPGFQQSLVWCTPPEVTLDPPAEDPTLAATSMIPGPAETHLVVLTLPPDSVYADPSFDAAAAGAEMARNAPGLAELFEPDVPGMHTTPTVDYNVVLDGEVWLELTGGTVHLTPGTVVVQHGTRHAWRNKGDRPVTLLAVMIGARGSSIAEGGE